MPHFIQKHIMIGMSGGVDSSVAAFLLKKQGHHVEGVFMKNWEEDDTDTYCPAAKDMADAQAVCDQLQIELHRINFATEYWERVFSHFLTEYKAGRTPNPDILCNKEIKFKAFLAFAQKRGADFIATGHYARLEKNKDQFLLLKAHDHTKDQSYFLHALNQTQLSQSLFPLGNLTKKECRQLALQLKFNNHNKKDSTGICFIGERKFKNFLNNFLPATKGSIKTLEGKTIGTHDGLMFYTIGQRQGLNIGGVKHLPEAPWYVAQKEMATNTLIVVQGHDHPALLYSTVYAKDIHWIGDDPILPLKVTAKTRYRQEDQCCIIKARTAHVWQIDFETPQRAITPGQYIVFYDKLHCLGGGIIMNTHLSH